MKLERYKVGKPARSGGNEIGCWKMECARYLPAHRRVGRDDPRVGLAIARGVEPAKRYWRGVSYARFINWNNDNNKDTHLLATFKLPDGDWGWYALMENPPPY